MKPKSWFDSIYNASGRQEDTLRHFLAKAVSGAFGLKILNVGLMYINSLFLVKLAGASGYGEYTYIIAWLQILLIPAALGFEGLIGRELAVYSVQLNWAKARGLLDFSSRLVLFCSLLLAMTAVGVFWLFGIADQEKSLAAFAIGMASLPFLTLSRLRTASLQAIKNVVVSQLPEGLIRPSILFVCLGSLFVFLRTNDLPVPTVMSINWVADAVAFGLGSLLLKKNLNKLSTDLRVVKPEHSRSLWIKSAMPMLLIGGMYVINGQTDSVMLGLLKNTEAVGVYAVANRGAGLIAFVQIAVAMPLAPVFATLFAGGELNKLRHTIKKSCRVTFALSLSVAAVLCLLSHWFLLIFGSEFLVAQLPLFILIGGQLVNSFTGATAQLLIMTGNDRDTAIGVGVSAAVNIVLNAMLIPPYGIVGAAIATAMSTVLWNLILVAFTYKRFKVISTAV